MKVANQYASPSSKGNKKQTSFKVKPSGDSFDQDNEQIYQDKTTQNTSLQNGQVTKFYFEKLIHIEYQLALVVVINIFLIVMSTSLTFPQTKPEDQNIVKACLYFCIICFITQCVLVAFRMITCLQLQKQQKILYAKSTIFSSKKILGFFVQCLILMIQPYPFFHGQHFQTENSYQNVKFYFPINDLLTIFSICRIYLLIRAALMLSPYKTNRSNRLCKMYGCHADFAFSLKCLFKDNPLILIIIFFFTSSFMFSFQIYLAERYAFLASKNESLIAPNTICNDFLNSFWLILMTITTVGYGDYFPQTPLGRMIILVVAVWGTFIVSIMVVVVGNTLSMQKNEKRTSVIVNKLQLRNEIQDKAKKVIGYRILYHRIKKNFSQCMQKQTKARLLILKNKCSKQQKDFSKLRKQLKLIIDYEDIQDEVSSHFLIINNDIEILNKNQENIISFIHDNLEYQINNDKKQNNDHYEKDSIADDEENNNTQKNQVQISNQEETNSNVKNHQNHDYKAQKLFRKAQYEPAIEQDYSNIKKDEQISKNQIFTFRKQA